MSGMDVENMRLAGRDSVFVKKHPRPIVSPTGSLTIGIEAPFGPEKEPILIIALESDSHHLRMSQETAKFWRAILDHFIATGEVPEMPE